MGKPGAIKYAHARFNRLFAFFVGASRRIVLLFDFKDSKMHTLGYKL
jgi:hypothetical protein